MAKPVAFGVVLGALLTLGNTALGADPQAPIYSCRGFEPPMNLASLPRAMGGGVIARKVAKDNSSLRREMPCASRTPRGAASTLTGTMMAALRMETNPSEPGGRPATPHPAQMNPSVPGMAIIGPNPEDVPTAWWMGRP